MGAVMRVIAPLSFRLVTIACFVAVLPGCNRYSRSTSGFSELERTLLYDFRQPQSTPPSIDPATQQKLAPALAANGANQVLAVADVNRDGKQEYLLGGSRSVQGQITRSAVLVILDKDKPFTMEDFGQVYDDNCQTNFESKAITASVIYFLPPPPNGKPRFNVELYRAACPAPGQQPDWQRVSGPR